MELKELTAAIHTLGCKVNIYESEVMEGQLKNAGVRMVPFGGPADICIINTCTVTNIADRKSRQMLHRARKDNPEGVVVVCGCYAETEDAEKLLSEGADLVLGNEEKGRIAEILSDYLDKGLRPEKHPVSESAVFRSADLSGLHAHTRADIKVQDGCNQFCTYCIIPYARGRIRSRSIEDTVREVRMLAEAGTKEVVLTGIHLSSYGQDLGTGENLLSLIRAVHDTEQIERIRLGSLEPRLITARFAEELGRLPKVCPHFHLSLQSGCAETLKRMNRHYTPEEYAKSVAELRAVFDRPGITADVIVGFPGETEAAFEESRKFVKEIGFSDLHVFKYSRRKGTVADRMPDQVPEQVKTARSKVLIGLAGQSTEAYLAKSAGRTAEVLTEEPGTLSGRPGMTGYTKEYIRVFVPGETEANRIVKGTLSLQDGHAVLLPG